MYQIPYLKFLFCSTIKVKKLFFLCMFNSYVCISINFLLINYLQSHSKLWPNYRHHFHPFLFYLIHANWEFTYNCDKIPKQLIYQCVYLVGLFSFFMFWQLKPIPLCGGKVLPDAHTKKYYTLLKRLLVTWKTYFSANQNKVKGIFSFFKSIFYSCLFQKIKYYYKKEADIKTDTYQQKTTTNEMINLYKKNV